MHYKYGIGDCVVVGEFVSHYYGFNREFGLVIDRYTTREPPERPSNTWYEIFIHGQIMPYLERNIKNLNYQQGEKQ